MFLIKHKLFSSEVLMNSNALTIPTNSYKSRFFELTARMRKLAPSAFCGPNTIHRTLHVTKKPKKPLFPFPSLQAPHIQS